MSFLKLFKKSPESVQPVSKKSRHRCPFYGFHYGGIPNVFMDQEGNQCAFIMTSCSPCRMEFYEETPDWNRCPFNNEKNRNRLESIKNSSRVFPKEFDPDKSGWKGIPFKQWMEYVMSHAKMKGG